MRKHQWIAVLVLSATSCAALAQPSEPMADVMTRMHASSTTTSPEERAESIVIFIPAEDVPAILPGGSPDRFIKGRITSVEKGVRPGAIVKHANTLSSPLRAGVPMKMYLIREATRDAYYPTYLYEVAQDAAVSPPLPAPEISVRVSDPLGAPTGNINMHGVPYAFSAHIQMPAGSSPVQADLYVGVIQPDGVGLTWVNAGKPGLRRGTSPLLVGINLDNNSVLTTDIPGREIAHSFTGKEPPGMYTVYALLVSAGATPAQSENWIGVDMKPLFIE
jgi:hypothetical protein